MTAPTSTDDAHAVGLLDKVRAFADTLTAPERELFAVLIGPGVEALMAPEPSDDEVAGFSHEASGTWKPGSLRANLATAAASTEWQLVERR